MPLLATNNECNTRDISEYFFIYFFFFFFANLEEIQERLIKKIIKKDFLAQLNN